MAGRGGAGDDSGGSGATLLRLGDGLKDKAILALLAVIVGGGGAAGYLNFNPPRPDPFTGTEGRVLEARIDELENHQQLDDEHRRQAREGWSRIRDLERRCTINAEQILTLRRDIERLENH